MADGTPEPTEKAMFFKPPFAGIKRWFIFYYPEKFA
jgi:hypothetical protein